MTRYGLSRLLALIPVLLGTSIVTFLLIHLVPGDPAVALLGLEAEQVLSMGCTGAALS